MPLPPLPLPPLATTGVGSLPRPGWLAATARSEVTFRMSGDLLEEALDDATVVVLREQEELGLDILTDGEMRRPHFIFHIAGAWDGIDTRNLATKTTYRNRAANRLVPRVTGKIVCAAARPRSAISRPPRRIPRGR